jgi:outer membrane protein insertion porin family
VEPVHLLLFYDTGNLYWRLGDFDPADLRQAAGLGLRLQTPIGPLRVEYGWKLDRQQGESSGELHFSLGVPF